MRLKELNKCSTRASNQQPTLDHGIIYFGPLWREFPLSKLVWLARLDTKGLTMRALLGP